MIVTFKCSKYIHVVKRGRKAIWPYHQHDSLYDAIIHLFDRGVYTIKII